MRPGYAVRAVLQPRTLEQLVADHKPTCFLDHGDWKGSTLVDGAISQSSDLSGNGRHFTQSTNGFKPVLTRADNRENRVLYSGDISQVSGTTYWQYTRTANISATEFREDGSNNTHNILQARPVTASTPYRISASFKRGTGSRNAYFRVNWPGTTQNTIVTINLATGAVHSTTGSTVAWTSGPTAAADGDYVRVTGEATSSTTAGNANIIIYPSTEADPEVYSYAGDNTSSIHVTDVQLQSVQADPTYIPTTDFPQYRGMNGRRAVYFDGVDDGLEGNFVMNNIFANSAKTAFAVVRPAALPPAGTNRTSILTNASGVPAIALEEAGLFRVADSDGSVRVVDFGSSLLNKASIVGLSHNGATLSGYLNGKLEGGVGCGASVTNSGTVYLGHRIIAGPTRDRFFSGSIATLIALNKTLLDLTIHDFNRAISREIAGFLI